MSCLPLVRLPCMDLVVRLSCRSGCAPSLADVEAVARLALAARRCGARIEVEADDRLRGLLVLVGLGEVLRGSVVEVQRQAVPREQL